MTNRHTKLPFLFPLFEIGAQVFGGLKFAILFSPMAVPFIYMAFILHFFPPSLSLSCQPVVRCGNIDISYPFYQNASQQCRGKFLIECNLSAPIIQFMGVNYNVMGISYPDQVITIQDPAVNSFFFIKECSFLYNFLTPIPNFDVSSYHPILQVRDPTKCTMDDYRSLISFFQTAYNSTLCRDYSLHYRNESEYSLHYPLNCFSSQPNLFEWNLSFSEENESTSFSLLSAGFSQVLEFREECFNCQLMGKNCSGTVTTLEQNCRHKEVYLTGSRKYHVAITAGSVLGAGFVVVCLSAAFYFYKHRKVSNSIFPRKTKQNIDAFLEEHESLAVKRYSYSDVKKITKAFQEKLGQGGFGAVFKGTLVNGHNVAVKILNDSKGDGEEFMNEVRCIGRTSHVNIVSLLGYCSDGTKRALIYDFMCNGSLEKLVYVEKTRTALEWEMLYQIALGIARGLEYLHRGCNARITHFDIKPHNILLDEDFCPKISDFGLAKIVPLESIISIAGARGTIGYIAPEVFSREFGAVSTKSDVYSYGMMLLEMSAGRKNPGPGVENSSEIYFPHWIYDQLDRSGGILSCGVTAESEETVRKMVLIGLWCIQIMPQNRPAMSRVIEMFQGSVNDLQAPPKPSQSSSTFGPLISFSSIQDISRID